MRRERVLAAVWTGAAMLMLAVPARAQDYRVELGTSLATLNAGVSDESDFLTLSLPATAFGSLNPGTGSASARA